MSIFGSTSAAKIPGRFGLGNPVRYPSRTFGGPQTWFAIQDITTGSNFTTTNTTDYLYCFSANITTYGARFMALWASSHARFRHSAPPASMDVGIFVDYGNATGLGVYAAFMAALYIPSATLWLPVALSRLIDLNTAALVPGIHTAGLVVRNNTAGTLEMAAPATGTTEAYVTCMEIPWKALA